MSRGERHGNREAWRSLGNRQSLRSAAVLVRMIRCMRGSAWSRRIVQISFRCLFPRVLEISYSEDAAISVRTTYRSRVHLIAESRVNAEHRAAISPAHEQRLILSGYAKTFSGP